MTLEAKPTIVFVHGAFAESSSWNAVINRLVNQGYSTVAAANPLRGVQSDADYISTVLNSLNTPILLVGHSYGGSVITNAVKSNHNVQALVYVAAFAPDIGESAADLSGRYPGSSLSSALSPVKLSDGTDLYIQQDKFWRQFAADLPEAQARLMAVTQRPITEAALNEGSGQPAWKTIPSWFIYGDRDLNIPPAALAFMAERAGSQKTMLIPGASHVVMVSHPDEVAELIATAATVPVR